MQEQDGLPKGWTSAPLVDLADEMCLGKMLDKNKNRGKLQPYLRNVNVRWFTFDLSDMKEMRFESGEETRFGLQANDLVVCEGGEPGRAAVWKGQSEDAKIQKALHRIRFRSDTYDPFFAMYYLFFGTTTNRFAQHYTGTTIKHLTGKALKQVRFPVPPVNEQHRIVEKLEELLSDLDAGVAALERVRANLKRYRASVLKAAVEGRLTAAWRAENPPKEPARELLARILKERRRRWEEQQLAAYKAKNKKPPKGWEKKYKEPAEPDKPLDRYPETWEVASVDIVTHRLTYGITVRPKYVTEGVPLISGREIRDGEVDLDIAKRISHKDFSGIRPKCKLLYDDILFGKTGTIGTVARVKTHESLAVAQNVAVISPLMNPEFLEITLRSPYIQNLAAASVKTTAIPDLQLGFLSRLRFCCF